MSNLNKIVDFLDNYLEIKETKDSSWNGLQIEGKQEIKKIAFCVTAGADVFDKIKKENPDLVIVHHGIFWKETNPSVVSWQKNRVLSLLKNNISLYACHLPLDKHKEVGNNAQILELLGLKIKEPINDNLSENIGWIGENKPILLDDIINKLNKELKTECIVLKYGNKKVKRIGVISGGAPYHVVELIDKKVDLYITGDPADITEVVKDAGINVIFAGHYATETVGVKALAKVLEEKFRIETVFVDFPTNL
jgi:dinuclear metal center YbgI/SA1388 family protein